MTVRYVNESKRVVELSWSSPGLRGAQVTLTPGMWFEWFEPPVGDRVEIRVLPKRRNWLWRNAGVTS